MNNSYNWIRDLLYDEDISKLEKAIKDADNPTVLHIITYNYNWDEVDLDNIVIEAYEQEESEEFPVIDLSKKLDITLKISKQFEQVLINQPICLKFGEMEKNNKYYFYDSVQKNRLSR